VVWFFKHAGKSRGKWVKLRRNFANGQLSNANVNDQSWKRKVDSKFHTQKIVYLYQKKYKIIKYYCLKILTLKITEYICCHDRLIKKEYLKYTQMVVLLKKS